MSVRNSTFLTSVMDSAEAPLAPLAPLAPRRTQTRRSLLMQRFILSFIPR